MPTSELWLASSSGFSDRAQLRVIEVNFFVGHFDAMTQLCSDDLQSVTSMCVVNDAIWIGDNEGYIRAYRWDFLLSVLPYRNHGFE